MGPSANLASLCAIPATKPRRGMQGATVRGAVPSTAAYECMPRVAACIPPPTHPHRSLAASAPPAPSHLGPCVMLLSYTLARRFPPSLPTAVYSAHALPKHALTPMTRHSHQAVPRGQPLRGPAS